MEVKNCKSCGRLFNYIGGGPKICQSCQKELEEKFQEVKAFLKKNPKAPLAIVTEETGVTEKQIKQWIREERLTISDDSPIGIECEGCGTMIKSGKYCPQCASKVQKNLMDGLDKPKPVERKKPQKEKERMRFLDS